MSGQPGSSQPTQFSKIHAARSSIRFRVVFISDSSPLSETAINEDKNPNASVCRSAPTTAPIQHALCLSIKDAVQVLSDDGAAELGAGPAEPELVWSLPSTAPPRTPRYH